MVKTTDNGGVLMQKLQFETSWNKALSSRDRNMIEELFNSTKEAEKGTIRFTPIWEAVNYKDELLITVLIHNFTESDVNFYQSKLRYEQTEEQFTEHTFTLPQLIVPQNVSMPWTFIFPADSREKIISPENGQLKFA